MPRQRIHTFNFMNSHPKSFSFAIALGLLAALMPSVHAQGTQWANSFSRTTGAGSGGFNFNNGPVVGNWDNFADFGDLILKATFDNGSFDNTALLSSSVISSWGLAPNHTATYGQTFIAPTSSSKLLDFTFYITDGGSGANFSYQAFVMSWSGSSLFGGSSSDQTGSSILYASNPLSYVGNNSLQEIKSVIGGGGLSVTPGSYYLFGLTTLGANAVPPTGPGIDPVGVPDSGNAGLMLTLSLALLIAVRRRIAS